MPISFLIDSDGQTIDTAITGTLLGSDLLGYLSDLLEHPDYRPGAAALVVCKDVRLGALSTQAIRQLVAFTRQAEEQFKGSRVAIVASQPAVYGLARMYQLMRDPPYEMRVFREQREAEAWLASSA